MAERRVAIIHAFSRANAGDGLLVDLTFEALQDAGVAREDCVMLALHPESFADLPAVVRAPGEPAARLSLKLFDAGREVIASFAGFGQVRAWLVAPASCRYCALRLTGRIGAQFSRASVSSLIKSPRSLKWIAFSATSPSTSSRHSPTKAMPSPWLL